ncbi:IS982 family transposase [Flavobacterium psychrophilum]|uniref:IS982 family transposase n=1 Tax=Flavobacterium psychrophilum TaxID=96345 RepID=UPI000B7C3581|nr:IS982 family transposase [Flavobacterium psychrophilum]EKT4553274.1 IS982 family transposase [Flavobacterium psychrophilum]ELY1993095.1 IS982 family transposase [Flavobacterium psychrophilum]MCB6232260.1 IS982 family transposase [Flavobacterium psychrophilum]QZK97761.1 IS982 family transposase [Flavobacterium psychrophilum]SNA64253.1 transposase [Flavobacterium psychrophilum]
MICFDKITDIFCLVDEFCNNFDNYTKDFILGTPSKRPAIMSKSEVITITILFHLSGFRCFKHFYIYYLQKHMQDDFPNTVSYNRFTELMQSNILPLTMFLKTCCLGKCTGISFVDSTPIRVCKNKRIKRNKVFKDIAQVGKSTMGYFYGFKLHIVINDKGEILSFNITQANVDDREPLKNENFLKNIFGKLFGDKGYISKELTKILFVDGIHLITSIRNNMKNSLMDMCDKINLRKRSVIETVNDELKNMCQVEHSRHRSVGNFFTNLIGGLIAYSFFPKKPSIVYNTINTSQLQLF